MPETSLLSEISAEIHKAVGAHCLLEPDSPVLLMVSGGSDSVSLARLLPLLYPQQKFAVLHVNHQLRGQQANRDEAFVQGLCGELGLQCYSERVDVAALAQEQGDNLEQAGRKVRYALAESWLDRLCDESGLERASGRIATAHTLDDRAETFLMRVIVGGGGAALASIPYKRGRVIRPLLNCRKQKLQSWLQSLALQNASEGEKGSGGEKGAAALWQEDASNAATERGRAFVRHELLPLLSQRNPNIVATLARSADVLASESEYLDNEARQLLPLTSATFSAPLALLRRAVYLAVNEAVAKISPDARITYEHIEQIVSKGAQTGFACHLPGGIEVRNIRGELRFCAAEPPRHDPRLG